MVRGADQAGWMVQKFVNNMCLSMVVEKYFIVKILESPVLGHDLFKPQFWFANLQLGNVPLSKQLTPGFPENMVIGKICLKKELIYSRDSVKARLIGFVFPFLHVISNSYQRGQIFRYVDGQCLNKKTYSAFGGMFRRNIVTYKETVRSSTFWCIFIIL